jgi:hypothetical protein
MLSTNIAEITPIQWGFERIVWHAMRVLRRPVLNAVMASKLENSRNLA